MSKPTIKPVHVTIRKLPGRGGWLHKETGRVFTSAAAVMRAVNRDGKRTGNAAHVITWQLTTRKEITTTMKHLGMKRKTILG